MIFYQARSMKQQINVYFNLTTKGIINIEVEPLKCVFYLLDWNRWTLLCFEISLSVIENEYKTTVHGNFSVIQKFTTIKMAIKVKQLILTQHW